MLACPRKCIETIGYTPKEFLHLLPYFETAIRTDTQFGRFRAGKLPLELRIMMVIHVQNSNMTYREFELMYGSAKRSVQDDVHVFTPI